MSTLLCTRHSVIAITALVVLLAFTATSANAERVICTWPTMTQLPLQKRTSTFRSTLRRSATPPEHSLFEIAMSNPMALRQHYRDWRHDRSWFEW